MRVTVGSPADGAGRLHVRGLLAVVSLAAARVAHEWLRGGTAALAVPWPRGVPAQGGQPRRPRAPAPAAVAVDSGSLGRARLAVLIDADNAQASLVEHVLAEVATFGTAHVKRAYGDWTGTHLRSWKDQLLAHSIQPIQQFAHVSGNNATDAAMVIDAMDLLYNGELDGFCLISSDSDFTRLASRLRESGRTVYGFGERKTPRSFVAACDTFVYVENLAPAAPAPTDLLPVRPAEAAGEVATAAARKPIPGSRLRGDTKLVTRLRDAVEEASDDDGWASQAKVATIIRRRTSDFDPRDYGYRKLGELIVAIELFEVERRTNSAGKPTLVYLRDRRCRRTPAG
jgi:uncharacterized LabA/DUF88 family protein